MSAPVIESKELTKRVGENLDYDFDYTTFLLNGTDSVSSSSVTSSPAGLTLGAKQDSANKVKQWISAGVDGGVYSVICTMTSTLGRIKKLELILYVDGA